MELLLNLVWVALAIGLFLIFWRREHPGRRPRAAKCVAMIALACVLLLLFPIISASDDLHPTQALAEEATRRVLHLTSPLHFSAGSSTPALLPALLLGLLPALISSQPATSLTSKPCVLDGYCFARDVRGPPFSRS
ncbi:MAG: hypothetical protein WCC25_02305 [Candidatus Korobacteraceae bacterium]